MKKAFTIIEVSILFVIFLIVAFLVAPLSLNESAKVKNSSRWIERQSDFANIAYSVIAQKDNSDYNFEKTFSSIMSGEVKENIPAYKISYMNGTLMNSYDKYYFSEYKTTQSNAIVAYKLLNDSNSSLKGFMMYDVNGIMAPNTWGKDIFGFNIYEDRLEPFCKNDPIKIQEKDCSRRGTGICCSNWLLIGGNVN